MLTFFLFHSIEMKQKALYYGGNGIIRNIFHEDIRSINIYEADIKNIVLSDKDSYRNKNSFEYFIGYIHKGNAFLAPLCIKLL